VPHRRHQDLGRHSAERAASEVGGKRLFVKEIEDALLRGDVDLAVHSSKDMPAALPAGLAIAGVLPREEPLDAVVLPVRAEGKGQRALSDAALCPVPSALTDLLTALGQAPSIGTGSVRRIAQLTRLFRARGSRRSVAIWIRGCASSMKARMMRWCWRRLDCGASGSGTGFRSRCRPTPAFRRRARASWPSRFGTVTRGFATQVARIDDAAAAAALLAERALVEALGGGCQTPVGALASPVDGGQLELVAGVFALDGSRAVRGRARAARDEAAALGARVGAQLLRDGAGEILAEAARSQGQ